MTLFVQDVSMSLKISDIRSVADVKQRLRNQVDS